MRIRIIGLEDMIHVVNITFNALIKEIKHSRQDGNKFSKDEVLSNYMYLCKVSLYNKEQIYFR